MFIFNASRCYRNKTWPFLAPKFSRQNHIKCIYAWNFYDHRSLIFERFFGSVCFSLHKKLRSGRIFAATYKVFKLFSYFIFFPSSLGFLIKLLVTVWNLFFESESLIYVFIFFPNILGFLEWASPVIDIEICAPKTHHRKYGKIKH